MVKKKNNKYEKTSKTQTNVAESNKKKTKGEMIFVEKKITNNIYESQNKQTYTTNNKSCKHTNNKTDNNNTFLNKSVKQFS